jgi:RAD50-interacting protein 1
MTTSQIRRLVPSISRERSPIAVLADRDSIESGERDIRLDDYLNDKLQTIADFESLDSLIASVETQRIQLQDQVRISAYVSTADPTRTQNINTNNMLQLDDAKTKLAETKEAANAHTELILQQTQAFRTQQESIDKRLAIVAASDAPDEAAQRLRGPMEKLRKLDLAKAYVELLKEVDDLTAEARRHLPNDPKLALKPYARLKQLSISLQQLQEPAEGAGVHIVKYVDDRAICLWEEMKKMMSDEFEAVLKKTHWPTSTEIWSREWSDCFEKLLDLQTPELLSAREPVILLPMAVITKTFVQQFKYHFMSKRPTNSSHSVCKSLVTFQFLWVFLLTLLQPDYFLEWTIGTILKWQDFLRENIGPILAAHFKGSKLAGNSLFIDPVSAFITALLPVLREKIDSLLVTLSQEPQFFSNFILLLMKFDESIRKEFNYDGGDPINGWKGLTTEFLDTWFDKWLDIEKEFALARYEDIITSSDNGQIDFDSAGPGRTKPTYGALKVADLLGNVTTLYESLRKFSNKLRFLIDIQLAILDKYHDRLRDSLDAYQAITSTVGRTLHGVTKEQQAALEGTGGLESLCKVYGSAEHIISALHGWSDNIVSDIIA